MIYAIAGVFMLLDMVTGLVMAFKSKTFTSSIMREGLFHKAGSVLLLVLAGLVDFAVKYMDLGVSVALSPVFCCVICLMEIGSIIENICRINPKILPEKIKSYFAKLNVKEEE